MADFKYSKKVEHMGRKIEELLEDIQAYPPCCQRNSWAIEKLRRRKDDLYLRWRREMTIEETAHKIANSDIAEGK